MTTTSRVSSGTPKDPRLKQLDARLRKAQGRPDSLIEVLHKAQALYGYLDESLLWYIARALKLPPSRVYGVASFYHLFRLKPSGSHTCVICTGTACFMGGAETLIAEAKKLVPPLASSSGERILVETVRCIGVCWLAPLVVLDGEIVGPIRPDQFADRLTKWCTNGPGSARDHC
jgi:bidirectional [NiFe] hydrogenase diaphorase subunit